MRKYFLFAIVILMTGCSKDDGEKEIETPVNEIKFKMDGIDITGVWKDTSYTGFFLSFSSDKLFSGYLDDYTIDDGDYSIKGDTITVNNTYLGSNIRFVVTQASDDVIAGNITYKGYNRNFELVEQTKYMYLKKTDDTPCQRNNQLIGKNFMSFTNYGGGMKYNYTVIQHNFMTFTLNTYDGNVVKYSGTVHYLYLPPQIYYTMYKDGNIWIHYQLYQLNIRNIEISPDGTISMKNLD